MAKGCVACKKKKGRCRCKSASGGVHQHVTVKIDQSRSSRRTRGGGSSRSSGMPIIPAGGGTNIITLTAPAQPNYHEMVNPPLPPMFSPHMKRESSSHSIGVQSDVSMPEPVPVPRANVIYDDFDVYIPRPRMVDMPYTISNPVPQHVDVPFEVRNPVPNMVDIHENKTHLF